MMYGGAPNERASMRHAMPRHDLVIMSYDILRNDVDALSAVPFNYCVLDEGHIIKNPRTKITQVTN